MTSGPCSTISSAPHLGVNPDEPGERVLLEWLGPGLRAELEQMEAWEPDPDALRQFEWPEGWLADVEDDQHPESPT